MSKTKDDTIDLVLKFSGKKRVTVHLDAEHTNMVKEICKRRRMRIDTVLKRIVGDCFCDLYAKVKQHQTI